MAELVVNGEPVTVATRPAEPLLDVLRDRLGRTGAKPACGRGECGACTVLLDGVPIVSCVLPVELAAGRTVVTAEEVARVHPGLAEAFAAAGAFQCGYCTPGQIVRASTLLPVAATMTDAALRHAISGNICRCTGYAPIVRAIRAASAGEHDAPG